MRCGICEWHNAARLLCGLMMGLALPLLRLRLRLPCNLHIQHIVVWSQAQWFFYISRKFFRFSFLACTLTQAAAVAKRKQWKWIASTEFEPKRPNGKSYMRALLLRGSIAVFVHKFCSRRAHTIEPLSRFMRRVGFFSSLASRFSIRFVYIFDSVVLVDCCDLPPVRLFAFFISANFCDVRP